MKKLFFTLAAVAALASCHKDADNGSPVDPVPGDKTPIAISPVTNVVTKAPIAGTEFPTDRHFMLSAYHDDIDATLSSDYFKGADFAYDSTVSNWTGGKFWPVTGTLDLLALSTDGLTLTDTTYAGGGTGRVTDSVIVTVPDNSTVQCDILSGFARSRKYSTTPSQMRFRHACAAIIFSAKSTVACDTTGKKNEGITIDSISVDKAYFAGKLTIVSDSTNTGKDSTYAKWSDLASQKDTLFLLDSATAKKNLGYNVKKNYESLKMGIGKTGMVVPEQTEVGFTLYYTLHNGVSPEGKKQNVSMKYVWTPTGTPDTWTEGKKYNYKIFISQHDIIVKPEVIDWDTIDKEIPIE